MLTLLYNDVLKGRDGIMHNKRKKLAAMLLAATLVVPAFYVQSYAAEITETQKMSTGAEKLAELCSADDSLTKADNAVMTNEQEDLFDKYSTLVYYFEEKADDGKDYPDYISGIYYDENEGIVVTTSGDVDAVREEVFSVMDEEILVKKEKFSYNELDEIKEQIEEKCAELSASGNDKQTDIVNRIVSVTISEENNCLYVSISDCKDTDRTLFESEICSSSAVIIKDSSIEQCSTELKPGMRIYTRRKNLMASGDDILSGLSIGCRAWRLLSDGSYEYGFITAAHGNDIGNKFYLTDINDENNYIGYVSDRTKNGNTDASFVALVNASKFKLSNSVSFTSEELSSGSYISSDFKGLTCAVAGATSNRLIFGRVTVDSCEKIYVEETVNLAPLVINKYPMHGLLECAMFTAAEAGDSGGLVFAKTAGKTCVIGFVTASDTETKQLYATKYCDVKNLKNWNIY